jgi:hypothetical protein
LSKEIVFMNSKSVFCLSVLVFALGLLAVAPALAQLPPEAVLLDKVKIPEKIKSDEICPVSLEDADPSAPTWTYDGVTYRGHGPDTEATFRKDPEKYAAAAAKERYIRNFMLAMSTIWCPITDEVTPGGRKQVEGHGLTWESCCSFCDEEMVPENFTEALVQLRKRAEISYELTGGVYTEGASSPVEGAIDENI